MKAKVYLETTIVSYLVARPSRDLVTAAHQQITCDWWDDRKDVFDLYVSRFVLDEAGAGDRDAAQKRLALLEDIPILPMTSGIMELADDFVRSGGMPAKAAVDALYVATATVYGCDYLLTWNCRHIANAEIIRSFRGDPARLRRAVNLHTGGVDGRERMNGKDEIVEEVRAARDAYAARFNYDIRKIYEDIKAREQASDHPVATLQPLEPHIPLHPRAFE